MGGIVTVKKIVFKYTRCPEHEFTIPDLENSPHAFPIHLITLYFAIRGDLLN